MIKDIAKFVYKKTGLLISNDVKNFFRENLRPSVRVVILMIIAAGITYSLLLVLVGSITLPFQSTGSLLTFDGKVVGSKLIRQEFKSDKLFHIRPAVNSTSTVDPHKTTRGCLFTNFTHKQSNRTTTEHIENSHSI